MERLVGQHGSVFEHRRCWQKDPIMFAMLLRNLGRTRQRLGNGYVFKDGQLFIRLMADRGAMVSAPAKAGQVPPATPWPSDYFL